jgi:hypothetical protein
MNCHGQVLNSSFDTLRECRGDDGTVALCRVSLVAEQRYGAVKSGYEIIEQRPLGGEIRAEIREVAREVAIDAQPMANVPGRPERTLVLIRNPRTRQGGRKRSLGESFAARDRELSDVEHACNLAGF